MKKILIIDTLWITIALILWISGLVIFLNQKNASDSMVGAYFIWGALCFVAMIRQFFKGFLNQVRESTIEGYHTIETTAIDYGDHVEITERRLTLRGFITGVLAGVLVPILFGQIIVPITIIRVIISDIRFVKECRSE